MYKTCIGELILGLIKLIQFYCLFLFLAKFYCLYKEALVLSKHTLEYGMKISLSLYLRVLRVLFSYFGFYFDKLSQLKNVHAIIL